MELLLTQVFAVYVAGTSPRSAQQSIAGGIFCWAKESGWKRGKKANTLQCSALPWYDAPTGSDRTFLSSLFA